VAGGIGIMNIMLVSVTERPREMSIRTAVAARRREMLTQVLAAPSNLHTRVGLDSIMLAFCVSAAIGLFFDIYLATRAARLEPIEALRYV
jgi:putative ABC transport system permease protein